MKTGTKLWIGFGGVVLASLVSYNVFIFSKIESNLKEMISTKQNAKDTVNLTTKGSDDDSTHVLIEITPEE